MSLGDIKNPKEGTFFEQTLRSKLRETGMLRLMPKTLALIAVQRQTAASRSTRPSRREQHGITGGEPMTGLTKPSTLAHTPNLRASLGHLPCEDGVLGLGFGFVACFLRLELKVEVFGDVGVGVTGTGVL
ncbi:transmembrane protein [Gossypium australe]|uniref:Transmembrane protein n=1 Tax=Gossypium australe TaxID=47621 RepID=A0A5B6W3Q8_9ROSI|nr:transmembrane protein [Gossypium australe]